MAAGMRFRLETPADEPFVSALYASTRAEELAPVPWADEQKHAFLKQQFQAQSLHYRAYYPAMQRLIIEHGGRAVGRLYVDHGDSEYRVVEIALMPEARSQGYGGAILTDLIDEAFAAGRKVSIHVERMNPALALYRRLGFEIAEDKGVYLLLERHPEPK